MVSLIFSHCINIYPVDSAIKRFKKRGRVYKTALTRPKHCVTKPADVTSRCLLSMAGQIPRDPRLSECCLFATEHLADLCSPVPRNGILSNMKSTKQSVYPNFFSLNLEFKIPNMQHRIGAFKLCPRKRKRRKDCIL